MWILCPKKPFSHHSNFKKSVPDVSAYNWFLGVTKGNFADAKRAGFLSKAS